MIRKERKHRLIWFSVYGLYLAVFLLAIVRTSFEWEYYILLPMFFLIFGFMFYEVVVK